MATKAMNIKMDESRLLAIKNIAEVFHITMTEVINEALDEYIPKIESDPFYRLTANVLEASKEESNEILDEIQKLSDDDLKIVTSKRFEI